MQYLGHLVQKIFLISLLTLGVLVMMGCSDSSDPNPTPSTIEGTWSGVIQDTYYCEGSAVTFQIDISDSAISQTGGTFNWLGTTGSITKASEQNYDITIDDGVGGVVTGRLYTDPSINYAVIAFFSGSSRQDGLVGILQKGPLTDVSYQESDLVGNWQGTAVNVDADLTVTNSHNSSASISMGTVLSMTGMDGDGSFNAPLSTEPDFAGIILEPGYESYGMYVSGWGAASQVQWGATNYDALYALSRDKTVLAAAFVRSVCSTTVFSDSPSPKLVLWKKQ